MGIIYLYELGVITYETKCMNAGMQPEKTFTFVMLGENVPDNFSRYICKSVSASLMLEGQFFVIQPE